MVGGGRLSSGQVATPAMVPDIMLDRRPRTSKRPRQRFLSAAGEINHGEFKPPSLSTWRLLACACCRRPTCSIISNNNCRIQAGKHYVHDRRVARSFQAEF